MTEREALVALDVLVNHAEDGFPYGEMGRLAERGRAALTELEAQWAKREFEAGRLGRVSPE